MSQVDTVALWAGLFASIAGIVLSIVATLFAVFVNQGAEKVNNQTIKSLQKIESSVDQLSKDTRDLITAAWNRMLGGMGAIGDSSSAEMGGSEGISTGIASEIRSELSENDATLSSEKLKRIEQALQDLENRIATQPRTGQGSGYLGGLDLLVQRISSLSQEARALLMFVLNGHHLERDQYLAALNSGTLKNPIKELRDAGLLVPLKGIDDENHKALVYWLPGSPRLFRLASQFIGRAPTKIEENIKSALLAIGYSRFSE